MALYLSKYILTTFYYYFLFFVIPRIRMNQVVTILITTLEPTLLIESVFGVRHLIQHCPTLNLCINHKMVVDGH